MRLALGQVRPDEDHGSAGGGSEDDEPGDVAVDLARGEIWPEEIADEEPAERRHRKRLDRPVDEERHADAAPVLLHLAAAAFAPSLRAVSQRGRSTRLH